MSAQCASCMNFEHFKCAGTRNVMKDDINEDLVNFFCTVENPSLGLEVTIANQNQVQKVFPIVHRPDVELKEIVVVEDSADYEASKAAFMCDNCGNTFEGNKDITEHIESHHKDRVEIQKSFECNDCEAVFALEANLNEHVISPHTEKVCAICQFKCKSEEEVSKHMQTHKEAESLQQQIQFKCSQSPFNAVSDNDLEVHIISSHDEAQIFKCEKWEFSTHSELCLETHMSGHMGDARSDNLADNLVTENATLK